MRPIPGRAFAVAAASGPIGLADQGVAVEFANIFVKPLKGSQR